MYCLVLQNNICHWINLAVGRVWVNVANYVDKGQITTAKLDKEKGLVSQQRISLHTEFFRTKVTMINSTYYANSDIWSSSPLINLCKLMPALQWDNFPCQLVPKMLTPSGLRSQQGKHNFQLHYFNEFITIFSNYHKITFFAVGFQPRCI